MLTFIGTARFAWTFGHTSYYATLGGWGVGEMLTFIASARFSWTSAHTSTLFLFPTNLKLKNPANFSAGSREKILFAEHEHGFNNHPLSCKHLANATVKTMKNTENTMKFPPTKRLRMDIHDLNICNPLQTHSDSRQTPRETQHVATATRTATQHSS